MSVSGQQAQAQALAAAAGAGAGELVTTLMFYPIQLVKGRLQASVQSSADAYAYAGLLDGILCVAREEGVLGLFTGIRPVVVQTLAVDFITVYLGELLISWYRRAAGWGEGLLAVPLRTAGACCSITLTLPLEAVVTRVTTSRPPLGVADATRQLWRESGLGAFWRGWGVSMLLCLNPALMLSTVDWLRSLLLALLRLRGAPGSAGQQQMTWAQALVVGAAAKLITMCAVYPLVRGKVLLQARDSGGSGILRVLLQVKAAEGLRSWYQGLGAQLSKSMLSASVKYAVKERAEEPVRRLLLELFQEDGRRPANGDGALESAKGEIELASMSGGGGAAASSS